MAERKRNEGNKSKGKKRKEGGRRKANGRKLREKEK